MIFYFIFFTPAGLKIDGGDVASPRAEIAASFPPTGGSGGEGPTTSPGRGEGRGYRERGATTRSILEFFKTAVNVLKPVVTMATPGPAPLAAGGGVEPGCPAARWPGSVLAARSAAAPAPAQTHAQIGDNADGFPVDVRETTGNGVGGGGAGLNTALSL